MDIKPAPGFQSVWLNPWREFMKVTDFNKPLDELKKEKGFMVRLALAKALDRDLFVKQALFGNGCAGLWHNQSGDGVLLRREHRIDVATSLWNPDGAKALMEAAGYPGGAGFPELELVTTPSQKRYGPGDSQYLQAGPGYQGECRYQGILGADRGLQQNGL